MPRRPPCVVCCQLINTKTQDGKQTLMHFLVDTIEKRFPDMMDFASELIHVEKAARGQYICHDVSPLVNGVGSNDNSLG